MNVSQPNETPLDQIVRCRDMFQRTGIIHDLQRFNVRAWADLVAPHLTFKQVEIRPESNDVVYDYESSKFLKFFKAKPPANFNERLAGLQEGVHLLLGDDYSVQVRVDGNLLFSGFKNKAVKKPTYEGVDYAAGMIEPSKPWKFRK